MDPPCPRFAHSAVCIGGKLLVWGGTNANKLNIPASNVEILNFSSGEWEIVYTRGTPPHAVWRSATIAVGTSVFNFGGLGDEFGLGSSDLHELDSSKMEWKIKTSSPSNGPGRKASCGIVQRGDNELVVVGGSLDEMTDRGTNEVHCIQLSEGTWYLPNVSGDVPPPCEGFTLNNFDKGQAVMLGGFVYGQGRKNDVYCVDLRNLNFKMVKRVGSLCPEGRSGHAAVIIDGSLIGSHYSQLFVVGGVDDRRHVFGDAWMADVGPSVTWKKVDLPPGVGPRYNHTATIISSVHRSVWVLVHGGLNEKHRILSTSAVIHLEIDISEEGPPRCNAVEVVTMKDQRRWRRLFGDLNKLDSVRQNYEKELHYGHINTYIAKVLLFGIAGSGKTSVTAIMTGEDPPQKRNSTALMARPVKVTTVTIGEQTNWEKKTQEEVRQMIAEIIRSRGSQITYLESQQGSQETHSESQKTHSESQDTLSERDSHNQQSKSSPHLKPLQPKKDKPLSPEPKSRFDSLFESVVKKDEVELMSLVHKSRQSSEPILEQKWLYIIDSGGQPEFHNMLSIFVQKATACIFIFRMHEGLDDYPPVAFYYNGRLVGESCDSRMNNQQIFEQFMLTMRSFKENGDPPRIVLLATHRDLVKKTDFLTELDKRHKEFEKIMESEIMWSEIKNQLTYGLSVKEFVFTMNAEKPEERDRQTANAIRRRITEKCLGTKEKIPIRWYFLDHRSRMISEGLERKVLSREEYQRIAESLYIDKESCENALKFFHRLNTIFYFPKALPNVVFLDPQILLDKLSELVAMRYQMNMKPMQDHSGPVPVRMLEKYHFQFNEFAEVTEELLSEFAEHYHHPLFTSKQLVILFEKLLIFGKLGEGKWFVPSILPSLKEEEVKKHRESKERALLIHFSDGGPQNGLFCSTVSYLLSPDNDSCSWEVLKESCKPVCLKRNVISFTVGDFPGEVNLIEERAHFELHMYTDKDREKDLWKLVYEAVFKGLDKAAETHHYSNTAQHAILCPEKHHNHPSTPHAATIDCNGKWMCTKCSKWFGQVFTETIPWLNVSGSQQQRKLSSGETVEDEVDRPTLIECIRFRGRKRRINIPQEIGVKYYQFGLLLLENDTIRSIAHKHREDVERINIEVLEKWVAGGSKNPVTWQILIQVLRDIELCTLAAEIEEVKC